MSDKPILKTGHNCWAKSNASRVAFLIDGENYYPTLHTALQQAQHSVYILAWDIDGRIRLLRDDEASGFPSELGAFFNALIKARPDLQIYILNWDWAMLYSLEREWLPVYKHDWATKKNIHFELDNAYPTGASQHQKVVVIDDKLAFCGGFDLGKNRWDGREHAPKDNRRIDPDNKLYPPFHDIQIMVEGDVAAKLGELSRERWQRATGKKLTAPPSQTTSAWPGHIKADIENCDVAISRTLPRFRSYPEIREVERLHLDAINAAKQTIYIENQYFTSSIITQALSESLCQENGPEIVMVLPYKTGGWLEQNTMDVLRCNALDELKKADKYQRLRVFYPHIDELGYNTISVHSKTLIIDDRLMRVGSSNLSNRSMGLDSECDLTIEAENSDQIEVIRHFRNQLLAEHLGVSVQQVDADYQQTNSVIQTIENLNQQTRYLKPLETHVSETVKQALPESKLIDPERPISSHDMTDLMLPATEEKTERLHFKLLIGAIIMLLLLAAAWRWTPMKDLLDLQTLEHTTEWVKHNTFSPIILIGLFIIGSLTAVPVTLMILVTIITFGPFYGGGYAFFGAICGAISGYAVGNKLGRRVIVRLTGSNINHLSRRLAKHGLLTVITVRIIPVAPFTITNMVAGASHINFNNFFWGTVLGMLPGLTFMAIFTDTLVKTIKEPNGSGLMMLAGIMLILLALGWLTKYWIRSLAGKSS